ncbi:MAG TPA: hypothetical protein VLA24_09275 [Pseudomonadales bacterium]|nr:hypothetical protein [Pseudomonadales bacterium]
MEAKTGYQIEIETKLTVGQSWARMLNRLLVMFPQWVVQRLDGGSAEHSYPLVIKAIPAVIVMLSVASISVINNRAIAHHAGWNSPLVSTGVAVLVPLATLAAALTKDRRWSALFWVVSFFVAFVSGSIQYNVYVDTSATGVEALEAYAFGYGIPFAEVLFAIMEAVSINQWIAQRATAEQEKTRVDAIQRRQRREEEDAEMERQRRQRIRDIEQEFENRKHEAEVRAYELKLMQDVEIERERAAVSIRIKERKVAGVSINRSINRSVNNHPIAQNDKYTKQVQMVELYRANPSLPLAKVGEELDVSKSTARNYRDELVRLSVLDLHGEGKQQLVKVNGQSDAFLSGELS